MSTQVSLKALRARATLYQNLRDFFNSKQILEVETTQNSADFPNPVMLQFISEGSGAIYQISKQFRADEIDRRHRPEFSVGQWNQPSWEVQQVLLDLTALLRAIFSGEFEPEQRTFQQAFIQRLGFDPHELSIDELRQQAQRLGLRASLGDDRQAWLKLMFTQFIEPTLGIDIPLYLNELPSTWRSVKEQHTSYSSTDVYIDGIKVGSVLITISEDREDENNQVQPNFTVVFGLDRLLMIVLETRQIEKVLSVI